MDNKDFENSSLILENFLFLKDQLTKAQKLNDQLLKQNEKLQDTLILITKSGLSPIEAISSGDSSVNPDLEKKRQGIESHLNTILTGESDESKDEENDGESDDIISRALEAHGK